VNPPPTIHRLRHNAREGSPHRLLIIDTEADSEREPGRELQTLKLWAAGLVNRHGHEGNDPRYQAFWGFTGDELASVIERCTRKKDTLWVVAHNLSYDLTLSRVLLLLMRRDWRLTRHNLASDAPWALLKRRSIRCRLVDSWSWLPEPLQALAQRLGTSKAELPQLEGDVGAWLHRCQQDVAITGQAFERLLDEWDRRRMGYVSLTGPGSAWNSMLHRQADTATVVDPDPAARAFERQAVVAGRREVWTVGSQPAGPYLLLDFALAHLTVCANQLLPDRRGAPFQNLPLDDWRLAYPLRTVVADCLISTRSPRYPLRHRGAVLHPIGTFRTVLAGPEIVEARARGELLEIGAGYSYRLGRTMQPWAQWALDLLASEQASVEPMLAVFLKMASRTVPGRWGMQVSRELETGRSWVDGWGLEPAAFGWPPARGAILHLNGEWQSLVRDQEADDAFPAVLAHVQSWVRLMLGRAIDALGGAVLQCNTDSVLVRQDALHVSLSELAALTSPLALRIKAWHDDVAIRSPQHLQLDGTRAYAGIPSKAEQIAPGVFQFWTWPKLRGQLQRGDPRGYVRELRTVELGDVPVTRWAFLDGCCDPPEARWSQEGGNEVLGPSPFGCGRHNAPQRLVQHRALAGTAPAR
jgi:hypothetical protein